MTFYLFYYFFRKIFTIEDILRFIQFCLTLVCIMGIIEFITGFNFFTTFKIGIGNINDTIESSYRDGILRVRGPYGHSLAYGLVINLFFPLTCLDLKKNEINILNNIFLLIIVSLNIFFTGARSSLGLFLLEVLVISLLSPKKANKKNLLFILFTIVAFGAIFIFFSDSEIVLFLKKQFYYVYDTIFGTNMAYEFGGNSSIKASSIARDRLWKIFSASSINPWMGQGVSSNISIRIDNWNVTSIDNYYVKLFITLGIPGLAALALFFIQSIFNSIKQYFLKKEPLFLLILISEACYLINLSVVDELSTLKYFFFLVALQECANRYILKQK
ncbi:O-antigen ligase family protein [Clostridium nigeriense]|uniref:O-antigen ligase family protein n=1 Tax=Clostridium nigeriense TaxID=1805470 RepID=UPI003D32CE87